VVSPGCLPRTPKIQNTGEAQRGPPILQAVHEMQAVAVAVAAGDNYKIINRCNSREIQDTKIEHPTSNRPLTFHDLISTHNLSCVSVGSVMTDIFKPSQIGRLLRPNDILHICCCFVCSYNIIRTYFSIFFVPFYFYGG
jgi:hypothetical protein